ncbi:MAG: hypothetical protein R3A44_29795 [Caldilineaceae bacterium]
MENWLLAHNINTTKWGRANAKAVADLWQELALGESRLQAAPVMRLVNVVNLLVHQNGCVLREAGQELGNGQIRRRDVPPAEKMRPDEGALTAALRCLDEELHVDESAFLSEPIVVQTQTHRLDSPSYPGLPSCFTIHTVEVHVRGLPPGEFSTLNRAFAKGDPVRVHHWRWQENEE